MSRTGKWVLSLVLVLVVVIAGLFVADRVSASVMEHRVRQALVSSELFQQGPQVSINGFPFLTQAISGTYSDVEISSTSVTVGEVKGATLDAHLRNAHVPLGDLLGNTIKQIPVDKVDGYVVVPFSEIERLSGVSGLSVAADGDQLLVKAPVQVPVLGNVNVEAVGTFTVDGSKLNLSVSSLKVNGLAVPSSLISVATSALSTAIDIPPLPYGLHVTSASTGSTGVRLNGEATNVVLQATTTQK